MSPIPSHPQWPFSADYTCWSGYFMNLFDVHRRLPEPGRSGVADPAKLRRRIGPERAAHRLSLLTLNQGLVKAIFQDRIQPVGAAMNAAKAYYYANAGGGVDIIDTMIFFGDTAMTLRLPPGACGRAWSERPRRMRPRRPFHGHTSRPTSPMMSGGARRPISTRPWQGVRVTTISQVFASAGVRP